MAERNVILNFKTVFTEERKGGLGTRSVLNDIRKQKEEWRNTSRAIGKMSNRLQTADGLVKTLRTATAKLRSGVLGVFEVFISGARHVASLGGSLDGVLGKLKRLSREGVVGVGHLIKKLGLSTGAANGLRTALRGVARFATTAGRLLLRFAGPIALIAAAGYALYKMMTFWENKLTEAKAKGIKLDERRMATLKTRLKLQRGLSAANRIRSDARTRNLGLLSTSVAIQRATQARDIARDDFRTSRSMSLGSRDPEKIRDAAKALGEYRSREEALGEVQKRRLTDQTRGYQSVLDVVNRVRAAKKREANERFDIRTRLGHLSKRELGTLRRDQADLKAGKGTLRSVNRIEQFQATGATGRFFANRIDANDSLIKDFQRNRTGQEGVDRLLATGAQFLTGSNNLSEASSKLRGGQEKVREAVTQLTKSINAQAVILEEQRADLVETAARVEASIENMKNENDIATPGGGGGFGGGGGGGF